jgi:hypothetical protein
MAKIWFYIYLAENAITMIHKDTFANAGKLRVIDLSDNALTFLHKDTFDGEYSQLSTFNSSQHTNQFTGLTKMHWIILSNNKIRALQPQMFSHLADLNALDLQNNTCVDKEFHHKPKTEIERELAACGAAYAPRVARTVQRKV